MTPGNVELLRRLSEAYRRGDVDGVLEYMHPDVVWNPFEEEPSRGADAVRAYLERWEAEWEDLETTPEEYLDAGDRVLVTVHFRGRGRGSGIEVEARSHLVYALRAGKVVRMEEFVERADALEAAGLSE